MEVIFFFFFVFLEIWNVRAFFLLVRCIKYNNTVFKSLIQTFFLCLLYVKLKHLYSFIDIKYAQIQPVHIVSKLIRQYSITATGHLFVNFDLFPSTQWQCPLENPTNPATGLRRINKIFCDIFFCYKTLAFYLTTSADCYAFRAKKCKREKKAKNSPHRTCASTYFLFIIIIPRRAYYAFAQELVN